MNGWILDVHERDSSRTEACPTVIRLAADALGRHTSGRQNRNAAAGCRNGRLQQVDDVRLAATAGARDEAVATREGCAKRHGLLDFQSMLMPHRLVQRSLPRDDTSLQQCHRDAPVFIRHNLIHDAPREVVHVRADAATDDIVEQPHVDRGSEFRLLQGAPRDRRHGRRARVERPHCSMPLGFRLSLFNGFSTGDLGHWWTLNRAKHRDCVGKHCLQLANPELSAAHGDYVELPHASAVAATRF
eukprot:4671301-Prymnesium_polylepis.1